MPSAQFLRYKSHNTKVAKKETKKDPGCYLRGFIIKLGVTKVFDYLNADARLHNLFSSSLSCTANKKENKNISPPRKKKIRPISSDGLSS